MSFFEKLGAFMILFAIMIAEVTPNVLDELPEIFPLAFLFATGSAIFLFAGKKT